MGNEHIEEGKWWVSPYNFVDEVRNGFDLDRKSVV